MGKKTGYFMDGDLPDSAAFRKLTGFSHVVLSYFMLKRQMKQVSVGKHKGWAVLNNGRITFTYAEAKEKGFRPGAFSRAIDQLVSCGFIDIARPGTGIGGISTLFAISERWRKYGTEEFDPGSRRMVEKNRFARPASKK